MKIQRKEQKLQRKEFIEQNTTLRFQRFENTFFNLVTLHHQIVDSIEGELYVTIKFQNIGASRKVNITTGRPPEELRMFKGRKFFKES